MNFAHCSDSKLFRLGQLLQKSSETTRIRFDEQYREITVKMHGKGASLRRKVLGSEIASDTRFVARSGNLILSRIDARNGAVAIVGDELAGAVVTNDFPMFSFDTTLVDPMYFASIIKSSQFIQLCTEASKGSTNRVRIDESLFLNLEISLPGLPEQSRIAKELEQLFKLVSLASGFQSKIASDFENLLISLAHREDLSPEEKTAQGWRRVKLGEVMILDSDFVKVDPMLKYKTAGCYSYARGLFHKEPVAGLTIQSPFLFRMRAGQFTYLKLKAFEGSFAFVSEEFDGCYVSNEYPMFSMDPTKARAEWLFAFFKSPRTWAKLASSSKGIGARRERVNPTALLAQEIWLPPLTEQDKIAQILQAKRKFEAFDSFERDAETLRRSILSKAFRGEL